MRIAYHMTPVLAVLLVASAAAAQPTLTGMVEFSCDSTGNASGGQVWNTLGVPPGGVWNLYVIQGVPGGSFVNSGDGPTTSISIPLSVGVHTFALNGDFSDVSVPYMGLNLFFAGDNVNPRISVFGANGGGGAATGGSTYTLAGGPGQPGANTLSFVADHYRVTLSDFVYNGNVAASDRVSPHDSTGNGRNDNITTFTLTVEAIPAVSTLTALGGAILGLLIAAGAGVALRRLG